ncbi:MAG: DNA-processing protein DprA [Lachnospiraceae bacterium]|nr:DNA-processing protein DprA [Lachnospiraceae bacterium]
MSGFADKLYWYWLAKVEEAGSAARARLFRHFDSAREVFEAGRERLLGTGIPEKAVQGLLDPKYREGLAEEFHKLQERDIYFVTKQEAGFPNRLCMAPQGPDWLFYRGRLPSEELPSVAVIGARECSVYGKGVAELLAAELAEAGIQIVSGMARGVDGYAQSAAARHGSSFAVLGSGVDVCYPIQNYRLYEQLPERGGILSEYAPGSPGLPFHFPQRNRIIAGLADGIVVVEARKKSGTLITVDFALEQGKEVFAVPGRIGEPLSAGCNELIRQGACLVEQSSDILEVLLGRFPAREKSQKNIKNKFFLEEAEKIVYAYLRLEPRHIEELMKDVDYALPELSRILFSLEAKGIVYSPAGNYYSLTGPYKELL